MPHCPTTARAAASLEQALEPNLGRAGDENKILRALRVRLQRSRDKISVEVLGALVAAALILLALNLPSPARDIVVGVAASFTFATTTLLLQAFHRTVLDTTGRSFFGAELVTLGPTFAYPVFELAPEISQALADQNHQLLYAKPVRQFTATVHRVDIPRAAAANDMEALIHLSSLFESKANRPLNVHPDSEVVRHCDCSFISVGLSSNDCTHLYLTTADDPLFAIVEDDVGSEYIRLPDGTEYRSDSERQVGLVLRYTPDPRDYPDRRWFIVAGAGPTATIGAAWFLTHCWRRLHAEAGPSDFATVISVPAATERRVRLERVFTR